MGQKDRSQISLKAKKKKAKKGCWKPCKQALRAQDQFGEPITLNYKGSSEFQTMPGGLLSILATLIIFSYTLMKLESLVTHKDWNLKSQRVLQT